MIKILKNLWLYILGTLWLLPLIWLVITAFRPKDKATTMSLSGGFTLSNFAEVTKAAPFGIYFINTLIIVAVVFIVQVITATCTAYSFARLNFKGKNILFSLVLVQLIIPNDVLIFTNYNTLSNLHLIDTKFGIMLPFFATAMGIFLLRQNFKTIPYEFEEAARLDGCNFFQILKYIYLPLGKPTYIAFGLVSVSYQWNNFLWPLIVTNSVNNRPLTVGLAIFATSSETGAQWAEVCAATLMVIFPLILAFFIFQKQFISSFMQSGIK